MASIVQAGTASNTALTLTSDTSGELQLRTNNGSTTALTLTTGGNINIPTTGARITGDFSNATVANRVAFQTSTTNGNTNVGVLPNGTSTAAAVHVYGASDPTNTSRMDLVNTGTEVRLASSITGTGTYIPMTFITGGSERLRIDTSGNVGIGTSSPTYSLTIGDSTAPTGITLLNSLISTDTATGQNLLIRKSNTSASGAGLGLAKSRGTAASPTAVANGDTLGAINFYGYGGTNYRPLSQVFSAVDTYTSDTNISSYLVFGTSPSGAASTVERMRIDSSGLVGIGTSSPSYGLHVSRPQGSAAIQSTTTTNSTYLAFINGGGTSYVGVDNSTGGVFSSGAYGMTLFNAANSATTFFTNATERMRIDSSGNVGIGTSSPAQRLHVVAADGVTNSRFAGASYAIRIQSLAATGALIEATSNTEVTYQPLLVGGSQVQFTTSGAERMRIHPTGEVSIGSTGLNAKLFVDATNQIAVYGNVNGAQVAGYFITGGANYAIYAQSSANYGVYGRTTDAGYGGCIGVAGNGTTYGIIGFANAWGLYTNASISVNGTTYTSDARLKENVVPISNALNIITQLNPVSFDWKANSARGIINNNTPLPDYGMIAQEVEQVLPDIVYEVPVPPKPIENNAPDSLEQELKACKGVDYSRLIPFLTKAIQELKAELDVAKAEIQALKGAQ